MEFWEPKPISLEEQRVLDMQEEEEIKQKEQE